MNYSHTLPAGENPADFGFGSVPRELYFSHQSKEIPTNEYNIGNAVWVSQNIGKYPLIEYQPLPPMLLTYAQKRKIDAYQRNEEQHRALAIWFNQVNKILTTNQGTFSLLSWCLEKLEGLTLASAIKTLEIQVDRFKNQELPLHVKLISEILIKDSREKI